MSDMYAIKASTLTAIGDAVRNKIGIGSEEKFEGIVLGFKQITASYAAPKYKYILNNASINPAIPKDDKYSFIICRKDASGEILYRTPITAELFDEIVLETDAQEIFIQFLISSHVLTCDVTIIPLDENGNEYKYTPLEMAENINDLVALHFGEKELTFSGNLMYMFSYDRWNWFIELFKDKITTKNIRSLNSLFVNSSNLKLVPFDLNMASSGMIDSQGISRVFYNCTELLEPPLIKGNMPVPTGNYSNNPGFDNLFNSCKKIREIPYDYFHNINEDFWIAAQGYNGNRGSLFSNCFSLRELPDISMIWTKPTSYTSNIYYGLCMNCYSLNEIKNLPVIKEMNITYNYFSTTVDKCYRLKNFMFILNENDNPAVVNWKSQIIDLSKEVGFMNLNNNNNIVQYNSGITEDKEVIDDTTYQALKNDPDWFTRKVEYSRYNHDSAVATINSLPDTSAYLATAGGTNTIKFRGASGSKTDGGAINTLTEEEIAVATAKGWTVSLV